MSEYGKIHTDGSRSGGQPLDDSIEAKALELINEVRRERGGTSYTEYTRLRRNHDDANEALCRAIEQHEAFKQEVSDAVKELAEFAKGNPVHLAEYLAIRFSTLIGSEPKPDPLALIAETWGYHSSPDKLWGEEIRAALDALGFELREKDA